MDARSILTFAVCALALAGIAHLIGEATDELGNYLGPAETGIVQSAVGNLPELFISIFALQAGRLGIVLVIVIVLVVLGRI